MAYWACAQLEPNRTALALHCLALAGFEIYEPRLREQRRLDGLLPAHVPDAVISEIRGRERNGLVDLVKPRGLRPGTRVRVIDGPLVNQLGVLALLKPHERVLVLLNLLGGQQRVELAKNAIEAVE